MDAQLAPRPAKAPHMRCDKIHQQDGADEMATRKNRNLETATFRWPPHEHTLEIALLCLVDAKMNLRDGAGKNQDHRGGEANDGQLEGGQDINKATQHTR